MMTFEQYLNESTSRPKKLSIEEYKIGDDIKDLGKITDIYGEQIEIDNREWYRKDIAQIHIYHKFLDTISFDTLQLIINKCRDDKRFFALGLCAYDKFFNNKKRDSLPKKFKDKDKKVVSMWNHTDANLLHSISVHYKSLDFYRKEKYIDLKNLITYGDLKS